VTWAPVEPDIYDDTIAGHPGDIPDEEFIIIALPERHRAGGPGGRGLYGPWRALPRSSFGGAILAYNNADSGRTSHTSISAIERPSPQ
jgi:hypothetical protein